jgi:hypothetical protein
MQSIAVWGRRFRLPTSSGHQSRPEFQKGASRARPAVWMAEQVRARLRDPADPLHLQLSISLLRSGAFPKSDSQARKPDSPLKNKASKL